MDEEMDVSPTYFDPEDLTIRERFRRYRKRPSSISPHKEVSFSPVSESRILYDGQSFYSPTNATPLETFKEDAESLDGDSHAVSVASLGPDSVRYSLKACKHENDPLSNSGDTTYPFFASLMDSSIQGLMSIPDLILRFESSCRNVSESIRYGSDIQHRFSEDKLVRQKAQFLVDEAASWSLLWYLYGKATRETPKDLIVFPPTSHLEACQFVIEDHTAQLCLRIVEWLEGLASKALDLETKIRGSHVGTYLPSSGVWHNTQRSLKKGTSNTNVIHHLDFDAPTREHAHQLADDKKQDESLLEDVWTLLKAGRMKEACDLCRSAGQPWRAATLCPFGGFEHFPSIDALVRNGKNRILQAIELESGIGHQWRLWKWASYCASEKIAEVDGGKYEAAVYAAQCGNLKRVLPICTDWESACWAMAKSWLDVQVDLELTRSQGKMDLFKSIMDTVDESPGQSGRNFQASDGPESWPLPVLSQQPRQISALLQKLHSGDMVHENVNRGCKEQQRQIQMILMLGDIPRLLDLIWSWIAPSEDDQDAFRPHGDPQMIRFGAHLVLVLRYLLAEEMKDIFREKIMNIGDLILHMYAMFLFSVQHEELVGVYASQLASHRCINLFVHMMELRLNSSVQVKYKIFLSAIEYLPFSPDGDSRGSFEEIIESVLSRSRETKIGSSDKLSDAVEQHRLQSLQKAMVVQWLCFTPPSTIANVKDVSTKLLLRALAHSNILFREFALISMWRIPSIPNGAHKLLSLLAEPLRQNSETFSALEDNGVLENLKEFEDWSEYFACDATYRNWLKIELENNEAPSLDLSLEEKQRSIVAANETLDSSFSLLLRKESPWLDFTEDYVYESMEPLYIELHAVVMLCLPSGECLCPEAATCTTLTSALYSSVTEEIILNRKLVVNVSIASGEGFCIKIVLRCLATPGDGLGHCEGNDGGILSGIMAAGFKGELRGFQAGVTLEVLRLDAWCSNEDGSLECPAAYIVQGLCRRCCLPEVILRCMQVSVALMELGLEPKCHDQLIELVASSESGFSDLFSQQQFEEFLILEREYTLRKMELGEPSS
ncbi:nuclear pore complex protein NUP107 [Cucurbita pepo subsp. pepo]|uniref:nuclear pore complex protein NUP107 n=1 Tax=Cucurbita pepo subsp. pepo TaxID=3664 RepID=UPI000C9D4253|nr:nuclear pore complex protein NUP107 [Cucurbita pepo subsp. pepo]